MCFESAFGVKHSLCGEPYEDRSFWYKEVLLVLLFVLITFNDGHKTTIG